jgi:hypothetical protein
LVFLGVKEVSNRMIERKINKMTRALLLIILFGSILVTNNLLLAAGPDKIDEPAYSQLIDKLDSFNENRTILVSTSYDYAFVRFAYPSEYVLDVEGGGEKEKVMMLLEHNETVIYIAWTISRDFIFYRYKRSSYNEGWVTEDERIVLDKIGEEGRYSAYLVKLRNTNQQLELT